MMPTLDVTVSFDISVKRNSNFQIKMNVSKLSDRIYMLFIKGVRDTHSIYYMTHDANFVFSLSYSFHFLRILDAFFSVQNHKYERQTDFY